MQYKRLYCGYHECWFCNMYGECENQTVEKSEKTSDMLDECFDNNEYPPCFEYYKKHDDYTTPYYICCKDRGNGQKYKRLRHGKRVEYKGITVFCSERLYTPIECEFNRRATVTEEITGTAVPMRYLFNSERRKQIREFISNNIPVAEIKEERGTTTTGWS